MNPHHQSSSRAKVITVMYETMCSADSNSTQDASKEEAGEAVALITNHVTIISGVERHHLRYAGSKTTMSFSSVGLRTSLMQAPMPALLPDNTI